MLIRGTGLRLKLQSLAVDLLPCIRANIGGKVASAGDVQSGKHSEKPIAIIVTSTAVGWEVGERCKQASALLDLKKQIN
jgi:hypothetical protein